MFIEKLNDRPVKRKPRYSEGLYKNFTCNHCLDYFTPPILECKLNHRICKSCAVNDLALGLICPKCRKKIDLADRRQDLESQMASTDISCFNKSRGCLEYLTIDLYSSHLKNCIFKSQVRCFYRLTMIDNDCEWSGESQSLLGHIIEKHKCKIYKNDEPGQRLGIYFIMINRVHTRIAFKILEIKRISGEVQVFLLEFFYSQKFEKLYLMIRSLDEKIRTEVEISLTSKKISQVEIFNLETCSFKDKLVNEYQLAKKSNLGIINYETIEKFKCLTKDGSCFKLCFNFK